MPRGKITQYEQGSFSKQAVGTPGMDQSGQIIGRGMEELGNSIAQYEEKSNAISAQGKFNDFRFKYENMKAGLQEEYRNDPKKFPEALNAKKQALVDEFSRQMSGGELKKFKQYEMNFTGQEIDSVVGWSTNREKEILVDGAKGNFYDVEYASESATTPEQLKALIGDPNNVVEGEQSIENAKKQASAFLDPGAIKELSNRTTKAVVDNHLSSRIRADATGTYVDLQEGKYDSIIENKNLLRHYTASAYTAMVSDGYREQFKNYATASVELAQMGDLIRDRKMSVGDVNRKIQWAELHKNDTDVNGEKIVTENYLRGLYANRDKAMGLRQVSKTELSRDQQTAAEKFESRWFDYLAGRKKKAKAQPSDYDNVIGLYADLEDLHLDGAIDDVEYEKKKQLLNTKLKSDINPKGASASLNEALQKAGNYGFNDWVGNPKDIYSVGYNIIDDHFKKQRTDLSAEEKTRYRNQVLVEYTRQINQFPEESRNPENKQQLAISLLYGNAAENRVGIFDKMGVYRDPVTKAPFIVGQKTKVNGVEYLFSGVNPMTGAYVYKTPDEFKKNAGK